MASVVGKTIFSDGKGKLFFGYYKTDDAVEFVDYKTWKKLNFKDVSKGDTNKERVIKAIVKNQKQFNKKVDFNMWAKKQKRSFEDTMDWFIQNGWISNITKRGIKEGVEDVLSVTEGKKRFKRQDGIGKAKYTISYHDGKKKHKDGSDFFDIKIFKNKKDLSDFVGTLVKQGYKLTNESVNEGILQDREKQLKSLKKGARVSGGGYGPFIKTGSNTFKSPKGKLANSQAVIKLLGAFGDFKIHEDKGEVEKIAKQVGKNEIKFYDALSKVEKRLGSKYPKFLDTALKQLKQNPAKFKTNADKEEAIFQSVK